MNLKLAVDSLKIQKGRAKRKEIAASAASLADVEALLKIYLHHESMLIFWQMHRILWGRWLNGVLTLPEGMTLHPEYTLELRAFNEEEELHLVKESDIFKGRYVTDEDGEPIEYVDTMARLWGHKTARSNGFVTLQDEERKLTMIVPAKESADYYGLVTRNYIGYSENGQAGYEEERFVKVTSADYEKGER